ncbi:hypothetical protein Tco_1189036 [Tanacetum coccineum]
MTKWYPNKHFECSLFNKEPDSHDHLFFECEYAQQVWRMVCDIAHLKLKEDKCENILEEISKGNNNKSIWGLIRKLCLAASVYFICCEVVAAVEFRMVYVSGNEILSASQSNGKEVFTWFVIDAFASFKASAEMCMGLFTLDEGRSGVCRGKGNV